MPDAITQKASGLQWNTVYEARIYAADAYGKTSNGYISATSRQRVIKQYRIERTKGELS